MARGARNMAAQVGLIAVSTHSSSVKPRSRETADFATATLGQGMASNRKDDIGGDLRKRIRLAVLGHRHGHLPKESASNYIPIHPDNIRKKDWVILLEAGTIIGPSADKLRVARATLEKRIVKKYNIFLRAQHFLVVDDYDPQIHAVYFSPQLYKSDSEGNLFPLEGEEIGKLIAQSLQNGVVEKQPWHDPASKLQQPIISDTSEKRSRQKT